MEKQLYIGMGDIHGAAHVAARIPEITQCAGVIVSGDMTNYGTPADVERVINELRRFHPRIFAQIGNMDTPQADDWLSDAGINLHRRVLELAPGLKVLGLGWSTPTPFGTPSEATDAQLGQWLDEARSQLGDYKRLLLVSHTPPHDTACDRISSGIHVGSATVRAFIEKIQPDVCLTGHIHESRAIDSIGRSKIINPGALADGGYVRLVYDGADLTAELASAIAEE